MSVRPLLNLVWALGIVASQPARANSYVTVISAVTRQNVYQVVYPSAHEQTDRAPGIYALTGRGDRQELVVSGTVLGVGEAFNGIVGQLTISRFSRREESLAIVDGRLTLFSIHSRPEKNKSMVIFGGNTPVIDGVTKRPFTIQPIENPEDVRIELFSDSGGNGGEILLISIRQPNPMGSGITIAAALRPMPDNATGASAGELSLFVPPMIIDYDFLSHEALAKLRSSCDHSTCVLSRSHLLSLATASPDDDRILHAWREALAKVAAEISPGARSKKMTVGQPSAAVGGNPLSPPRLELAHGSLSITQAPTQVLATNPYTIIQKVEPSGAGSGVFLRNGQRGKPQDARANDLEGSPPNAPGRIQFDARAGYRIVDLLADKRGKKAFAEHSAYGTAKSLVLTVIDGMPWLILNSVFGDTHSASRMVKLNTTTGFYGCSALSGHVQRIAAKDALRYEYVILISYQCNKREQGTLAFLLEETRERIAQVSSLRVSNKYYDSVELEKRVWSNPNKSGDPIFDNVNEEAMGESETMASEADPAKEEKGKTRDKIPTSPFLDLLASLKGPPRQVYLTHQTAETLDGGLEYRTYSREGATHPWTGFYVKRSKEWPESVRSERDENAGFFVEGYLLDKRKPMEKETGRNLAVITEGLKKDKSKIEAYLTVAPVLSGDPQAKGTKSFTFLVYMRSPVTSVYDGDATATLPSMRLLNEIVFQGDGEDFVGGQIIQGRRSSRHEVALLLFFAGANRNGVVEVPLRYGQKNESGMRQWKVDVSQGWWIYKGDFNPATLKSRILFDNLGAPYWIDTPDKDRFDPKYTVRNLTLKPNETLYLNRPGTAAPPLRFDESIEDLSGTYYGAASMWEVKYSGDLTRVYKGLHEYMETGKKAGKKGRRGAQNLFPTLEPFLESLAFEGAPKGNQVVLIEKDLKEMVQHEILSSLLVNSPPKAWAVADPNLRVFDFDPATSPETVMRNLEGIGNRRDRTDVLFVDLSKVLAAEDTDPPASMVQSSLQDESGESGQQEAETASASAEEGEDAESENGEEDEGTKTGESAKAVSDGTSSGRDHRTHSGMNVGFGAYDEYGEQIKFDYSRLAYVATQGKPVNLETFKTNALPPRYKTILLGTPDEWRRLVDSFPKERKAGIFESFTVNTQFLTGSWTIWPPNSGRASERIKKAAREPISRDEFSIFRELDRMLVELADPNGSKEQRILVVPEELKTYISALITTRWATNVKDVGGPWSYRNPDLALFEVLSQDGLTQQAIMDNFEGLRGVSAARRAVLYADMAEVIKIGRPPGADDDHTFRIRDPILTGQNNANLIEKTGSLDSGNEEADRRAIPHAIWWLASEGRFVQPKKTKDWEISSEVKPSIPMLILATDKELEALGQHTSFESRFFDVKKHFAITRLEKPSTDAKVKLVQDLFGRPEISSLNYEFTQNNLSGEEAKRQLIGLFVGRVDQIARSQKIEPTDAFTRTFVALKRALTEDAELRRARKIDRHFLERLYSRVFPLPLSYEVLPPGDFLHKFRDANRAARGLTDAGYEGALELKERTSRTVSAQTRGVSDSGMKIPSSQILFGDTSTGKTFLVESTIRYAGLKLYDFDRPSDEDAQAMIIKVQEIAETKESTKAGQISIDDVLEHISNFLALPNGHRGLILFDDLHKAQSKVIWQKLKTRIESFFDARDGLITVQRLGDRSSPHKIPVRNLLLYITVNPQDDEAIRKSYVKGGDDIVGEVMAALNKSGYDPVDRSFFARWSDIIDLRKFPRDAKIPTLLKSIRAANSQFFATRPNLILVTSRTMDELSGGFENANAREFLNPATYALLEAPSHLPSAPIYIVDKQRPPDGDDGDHSSETSYRRRLRAGEVETFVRENTVQYPVTADNALSKLRLMSFMMDNFRTQVYSSMVLASQGASAMSDSESARRTELVPFLLAVMQNLQEFPSVPLKDVGSLRPSDFKIYDGEDMILFEQNVHRLSVTASPYFQRIHLHGSAETEDLTLDSFLSGKPNMVHGRSRLDVMRETAEGIEKGLELVFARFFRMRDLRLAQTPEEWIKSLPEDEMKEAAREIGIKLVKVYELFQANLYNNDLEEMRKPGEFAQMSIYDRSRLFLLCLDRAITQLPWGHFTQFLVQAMDLASRDLTLSGSTQLQQFAFESQFSPFNTVTPDSVIGLAQSVNYVREVSQEKKNKMNQYFGANCESFLRLPEAETKSETGEEKP